MFSSNDISVDRSLCPLCGEQNAERIRMVYDRELKLCRCTICGMVFRVPLFGSLRIPRYDLFYRELDLNAQLQVHKEAYQSSSRQKLFYDYYLSQLVTEHGTEVVLLDIGCGSGNFLDRAEAMGIRQRVGIDPQKPVVALNQAKGIHDIIEGYYTRDMFKEGSFNVIHHSHVLEHVQYPVQFLSDNYYHLSAGGTLAVRVPSIRSPEWWLQVLSRNRLCRRGPLNAQHLVYFTPNTLKKALKLVGFVDVRIQTGLWAYKRPRLRAIWKLTVDPLFDLLKLGDMLVFASRPSGLYK